MARTPRTPRGGAAHKVAIGGGGELGGSEKGWRWRGWRDAARAEVLVAVGFLATLALLVVVFGGGAGSLAAVSSPEIEFVQEPGKVIVLLPQLNVVHLGVEFSGAHVGILPRFDLLPVQFFSSLCFVVINSTLELANCISTQNFN
jgi:hypothetical protein